ncbi:MAG: PrsW family intramembrane metalloprotease [Anaerolineae bacterium]|nr:PrsW family intramembrane metalloprotease [Anaerolineae bacterium]
MQWSWKNTLPTIAQFIISLCGFVLYGTGFLLMLAIGIFYMVSSKDFSQTASFLAMAWTAATAAVLNLPSIIYAILRLLGRPQEKNFVGDHHRLLMMMLAILPLALLAGATLSSGKGNALLLISPMHLLAVIIPLWIILDLGSRHLKTGSPQFTWGLLSVSLTVVPLTAILVELFILSGVMISAVAWMVYNVPGISDVLNRLQMRLAYSSLNPEVIWRVVQLYVNNPLTMYMVLAVFSGFVPLIEELLKPVALWFLVNRRMTPAEGWVAGMICGAAFALFESMNAMTSSMNSAWMVLALGRMGTGLLHIVTSGFMGWALAATFEDGRYLRLLKTYLLSVFLHALWNGLTVILSVGPLVQNDFIQSLGLIAPLGVIILFINLFVILLHNNRVLKRQAAA